jgi:phosphonoacetaldehyde hydrolase
VSDVEEGLNAGMWTVGLALTGYEVGLSAADWQLLVEDSRARIRERAYDTLRRAGAHFVVDGIADLPRVVEDVERRLAAGEAP